jgi:hypothetical protein
MKDADEILVGLGEKAGNEALQRLADEAVATTLSDEGLALKVGRMSTAEYERQRATLAKDSTAPWMTLRSTW